MNINTNVTAMHAFEHSFSLCSWTDYYWKGQYAEFRGMTSKYIAFNCLRTAMSINISWKSWWWRFFRKLMKHITDKIYRENQAAAWTSVNYPTADDLIYSELTKIFCCCCVTNMCSNKKTSLLPAKPNWTALAFLNVLLEQTESSSW